MTQIDYAARVKRGAELLDQKRPGWERAIDLDRLRLADGCDCVLGQIYGSYTGGALAVGAYGMRYSIIHGFQVEIRGAALGFAVLDTEIGGPIYAPECYARLHLLWHAEIRARLAPEPAPIPAIELPAVAPVPELQLA